MIVPEAMNRYYLSGYLGRVGSTWMTSDDREKDIEDNHEYLEALTDHFLTRARHITTVNVLAFSQGIATACRWMSVSKHHFSKAILWAGSLPPDLNWNKAALVFQDTEIQYVFGEEDEFFDDDKIGQNIGFFKNSGIEFRLVKFEGKHEVDQNTLEGLLL